MDFTSIRGEQAVEMWADLIEPLTEIIADKEIQTLVRSTDKQSKMLSKILKSHKHSICEILAILEGKSYDEFIAEVTMVTLPKKILALINNKELMNLFTSQEQTERAISSASALENTEV